MKKISIFGHFSPYTPILLRDSVKLNVDSEFLVHLVLGPHFMGLKWDNHKKKLKKNIFCKYFNDDKLCGGDILQEHSTCPT